jgi:hypothetical protein
MKFLTKLFAIVSLVLSAAAFADGSNTNTTVASIESDYQGRFWIYFSTHVSGGPSCATQSNGMVIDATTPGGKEEAAIAELAYSLGQIVTVVGQGTCALVSGWETLKAIKGCRVVNAPGAASTAGTRAPSTGSLRPCRTNSSAGS